LSARIRSQWATGTSIRIRSHCQQVNINRPYCVGFGIREGDLDSLQAWEQDG